MLVGLSAKAQLGNRFQTPKKGNKYRQFPTIPQNAFATDTRPPVPNAAGVQALLSGNSAIERAHHSSTADPFSRLSQSNQSASGLKGTFPKNSPSASPGKYASHSSLIRFGSGLEEIRQY
jgi:hypothetical protein